jgi:hypothetical protein
MTSWERQITIEREDSVGAPLVGRITGYGAPETISIRAPVPATSLWFADDPAGNARRGGGSGATGKCMDYDRCSTIAENGVVIVAESYVWRDYGNVGCAIGTDDERKIRNVACGSAIVAMLSATGIEVRASGFEVGRVAFSDLMNVNGVFARRQILDVERDFDAFWRAGKLR